MSADMSAMVADVIPEIVLLTGGVLVLLYALVAPRRAQGGAAAVAALTVLASAVAALAMLGGTQALTFTDTYATDDVAVWAKLIVFVVTLPVIGLSVEWFRSDPRQGEYYTLLLFAALGAALLAGATELMQFAMSMLLSSATGYVLTAYHRQSRLASEAAMKYYLLGAFTNSAMLIGVAYLFGLAGATTLPALQTGLPEGGVGLLLGTALVVAGLAFKIGAVPAHAWMPDVAQGAPAPVAAFVTSAPKVGALIFLARLAVMLPDQAVAWRELLALLAAATMTLGNLAALRQDDVRRLLGWSSVSQTGYGLLGVVALGRSELAEPSLLLFLVAYVLANVAAFGVVVELRGRTDRLAYAGLARSHPWLAGTLVVSFLSFVGIPPLAGFGAKLLLFAAAIEGGYAWLAVLGVVNTLVSVVYYARVLAPAYFGALAAPFPILGRWALWGTLAPAALVIIAGVGAEPLVRAFEAARLLPG